MGSNSFNSLNFTPTAAKLAQPVNCFVVRVVDSFMMILLSQSSDSTRGMAHHCSFGKSLSCGSLPLVWAKFRYLHFRGEHPDRVNEDGTHQKLTLTECDVATELNGYTFDTLPTALQIKLKRNFVRVEVIRRESDSRLRYYVFKRLNTGGELLSEQEIRNCTIRLLDNTFNDFIIELAENSDFRECISS